MSASAAGMAGWVAVVTGGASGIGEATCSLLCERGAHVVILDIDDDGGRRVAASLPSGDFVSCDVRDSGAVDRAVEAVVAERGRLDVVVNSAGPHGDDTKRRTLDAIGAKAEVDQGWVEREAWETTATLNLTDEAWRAELDSVLSGVFHLTRAALRTMLPAGRGSIVSLSSIHGVAGGTGLPHYSAAKAGILGLTRSVAKEVAPFGVRVNAIASGYADTPTLQRLMPKAMQRSVASSTPMGRLGTAEEIARVAVFLASDESSFMTGQTLSPNGGWLTV